MKKKLLYSLCLLAGTLSLVGCKDDKTEEPPAPIVAEGILYKGEAVANDAIIEIPYGEATDLNTLFSIKPDGAQGTLKYTLVAQPQYMDITTNQQMVTVNAWTLNGSTLNSVERVPDALEDSSRGRTVIEGAIRIELTGQTNVGRLEVTIVQKNKPALPAPTLSFAANDNLTDHAGGNGNKVYTLEATDGQWTKFNIDLYNILPLDYNPNNIVIRPCPGATYIETSSTGEIRTGGDKTKSGENEYIVGFYLSDKGATETDAAYQARLTEAYDAAIASGVNRIYVKLTPYVEPSQVVGIVIYGNIGDATATKWTKTGRKQPADFIRLKLASGDTRPYDGSTDSKLGIMAGEFTGVAIGATVITGHTGWFNYVNISTYTEGGGDDIGFTVTSKEHKLEEGWTVTVNTKSQPVAAVK